MLIFKRTCTVNRLESNALQVASSDLLHPACVSYAQIELQVLRYKFKRVSFLQKVQNPKISGEGHKSAIEKQCLVKEM